MNAIVRIDKVSKEYNGKLVLPQITFCVEPGEAVVVTGPSGSGKTTLLRILSLLESPTHGCVYYRETEVSPRNLLRWNSRILSIVVGYSPQRADLWEFMTVRENVESVQSVRKIPKKERKATIEKLFERLEITSISNQFPAQLSGGEQQRVALARALALSPDLLILDEPTSNLDDRLAQQVWSVIDDFRSPLNGIVVVSHHELSLSSVNLKRIDLRN